MKILVDTNVIINYITKRPDSQLEECVQVMRMCAEGGAEGYISLQSISAIWYILRKTDAEDRRRFLKNICSVLKLAVTDDKMVMRAIENSDFADFEDNLQDCCAAYAGADYIVTVNKKDFEGHSGVTPLTPAEFVSLFA